MRSTPNSLEAQRSPSLIPSGVITSPRSRFGAVALSLVFAASASAQSTWTGLGADANWGTAANWSTPIANSFSTGLIFDGSTQTTNTNNLTGGTATSLTFASTASAFTLGGTGFTIGTGTATTSLTNSSSVTQTINNNVVLGNAGNTWALTSGGLTLGGAVSVANTASGIILTGGNALRVNTTSTLSGTSSQITLATTTGQKLIIGSGATVTGTLGGAGVVDFIDATSTFVQNRSGVTFGGTFNGAGTIEFRNSGDTRFNVAVGTGGPYTIRLNMTTGLNSGGVYTNANGTTRAYNFNVVGNGGFYRFNAGTETLSGAVTGNGQFNLRLNGATTGYNLTGNWAGFTGKLQLSNNAGVVSINNVNSSTATAAYDLANTGAILQTGNAVTTANLGLLTGVAGSTLRGNVVGTSTFSIGALGTNTTFAGAITNGSTPGTMLTAITKTGSGTLTLTGTNTYTGGTNINQGTINTGASGTNLGAGNVTLNGGNLTLNSAGVGNLMGIVNFTQNTGTTTFDIASISSFDSIAGTGVFSISGGTIVLSGTLVGDGTDSYQIFSGFTGGSFGTYTFDTTGLANLAGRTAMLSDGGTLTFTAVPEPHEYAVVISGLLLTVIFLRRRRLANGS